MRLSNLRQIRAAEDPRYADEAGTEKQRCHREADADMHVGELHASIRVAARARAVDSKRPGQEAKATAEQANAPVREEELGRPLCTCTEHMRSCSAAVIRSRQIGPHQSRQSEIRSCCLRRPSRDRRWLRLPQRKWLSQAPCSCLRLHGPPMQTSQFERERIVCNPHRRSETRQNPYRRPAAP
jgi:hypothetical protein